MLLYVLGFLTMLSIALAAVVVALAKYFNESNSGIQETIGYLREDIMMCLDMIRRFPQPVQNLIQLDFRGPMVQSSPLGGLSIKIEDFKVNPMCLYEKLLQKLYNTTESETLMQNVTSRAYCILDHAGVEAIITTESRRHIQSALERLLINGDEEAIKRFLFTAAESICNGPVEVVATPPAMK